MTLWINLFKKHHQMDGRAAPHVLPAAPKVRRSPAAGEFTTPASTVAEDLDIHSRSPRI